jgi:tetratricopeptide (TPR) repeat protein
VGERGAYRLVKTPDRIHVPATVQAILAARIDRLPPEDKALLQTAAVIGTEVPVAVLAAVAEVSADALADLLVRLQSAEFLYETSLLPDTEYTFKHALTHEVAYGSLLHERRRALHARTAEAIENLYPERLTEHIERLAHHALRGETWDKAVRYLHQAGGKAMERSAAWEAAASCDLALATLQHLPDSRARTEQAIDLHLDASGALLAAGGPAKGTDHAREAEVLAAAIGDARRQGQALASLAARVWAMGDSDRAIELNQRALAISPDDATLQASVNRNLGFVWQTTGEYRSAVECLRRAQERLQGYPLYTLWTPGATSTSLLARLVWCLVELGEFGEAMANSEEALRIARELDHPASLVFAHRSIGLVSLRRGDLQHAIPPLEQAVEICRAVPVPLLLDVAAAHLGYAYALTGRLSDGVALLGEALANPATTGTINHPLFLAYLGETHLLESRLDEALAVARRALDLAYRQKERGNEAWVIRLFGEIAAHTDPPDLASAQKHYRQVLARADGLGMRPLVAHCHLGLGKLYRRTGDDAKASQHLSTATTMYREMDMGFWLAQAETACAGGDP